MNAFEVLANAWERDPVGAGALIDEVVLSIVTDDISRSGAAMDKLLGSYVAQQVSVAKRELARGYAEEAASGRYPGNDRIKVAEWLSGIESYVAKSAFGNAEWEEKEHPRDAKGRFVRGVSQSSSVDPLQKPINAVSPNLKNSIRRNSDGTHQWVDGTSEKDKEVAARHQAQYQETDRILRDFANTFGGDAGNVMAVITGTDPSGAFQRKAVKLSDSDAVDRVFRDNNWTKETNVVSIEVAPKSGAPSSVEQKVDAFNRYGEIGGQALARMSMLDGDKKSALASVFEMKKPEQGLLQSLIGRIGRSSAVLDALGEEKLSAMAGFIGTMGPEAVKIMEPHVLRASYRYRGTEKEPDEKLQRLFQSGGMRMLDKIALEGQDSEGWTRLKNGRDRATAPNRPGGAPKADEVPFAVGSAFAARQRAKESGKPLTSDNMKMSVRADVAAEHLLSTIPLDPLVAALSRKSGDILPSHGILVDADGDLISQSVGTSDDTYLPFDFGNLAELRGGQYIRTRQAGGLTGEDIATAVKFGARRVTVVSTSGVFTLDLDPNFRGARGNGLQAQQMYVRYLKILDAVENSGLYSRDISPAVKAGLKRQASYQTSGAAPDSKEFREAYEKLLDNAREEATQVSEEDAEKLLGQAEDDIKSDPKSPSMSEQSYRRLVEDRFDELMATRKAELTSKLKLNAEGYRVALETLQQQFPYFIREARHEELKPFLRDRGASSLHGALRQRSGAEDQGYMRPGDIRASSVQSGYYRTGSGMRPKRLNEERTGEAGGSAAGAAPSAPPSGQSPPATTSANAPGAPAAPASPAEKPATPAAPPPAPSDMPFTQAGLARTMSNMKPTLSQQKEQTVKELREISARLRDSVISNLKQGTMEHSMPTYAAAKDSDRSMAYRGLMLDSSDWASMSSEEWDRTTLALLNPDAVKNAVTRIGQLTAFSGVNDFIAGTGINGAKDLDELTTAITRQAQISADVPYIAEPFTAPKTGPNLYNHRGPRAQAFPEIVNIQDKAQLVAHLQALADEGSPVPGIAIELSQGGNGLYAPVPVMAQRLSDRIAMMDGVDRIKAQMRTQNLPVSVATTNVMASLPGGKSVDSERAREALAWLTGTRDPDEQKKFVDGYSLSDNMKRAGELQQGYSLAMAARSIEALDSVSRGSGDVLGPKAQTEKLLKSARYPEYGQHQLSQAMSLEEVRGLLGVPRA